MKMMIHAFKAASSRFGVSVLAFVTLFHIFLTDKAIFNIEDQLESFATKSAERIHNGLVEKDLGIVQDALRLILGRDANWLAFSAPGLNEIALNPILVGNVDRQNSFQMKRTFDLNFEGARLGTIDYYIDLPALTSSLFLQNAPLYLFVILFMISIIAYINEGIMRKLAQLNHDLEKISEAAQQTRTSVTDEFFRNEIEKLETNPSNYSNGLVRIFKSLQSVITAEQKIKSLEATSTLAKQVAHDIRSPLSALDIVLATTQNMPEEKRNLARAAITRIKDIANDLLSQTPKPTTPLATSKNSAHLISSLLESILTEKRIQYKNLPYVEIHFEPAPNSYGLFANIDAVEFKRLISNLVNNAVEALPDQKGRVLVLLSSDEKKIICEIRDNGKGIPARILSHLGKKGVTFGKEGTSAGSGLGLYHAKTTIEAWNGRLDIHSIEGKGTNLLLSLQRTDAPNWFCESLSIPKGSRVVVLDDDSSIHKVWESRLQQQLFLNEIEILHFTMPEAFERWHSQKAGAHDIYLIDQSFASSTRDGLDVIRKAAIMSRSTLVTNQHEDAALIQEAETLGVRILPKLMASIVPIDMPQTQSVHTAKAESKPEEKSSSSQNRSFV